MQTCRLRAARGRGTAAYPLHPRSCAPGLHRWQTRRPGTDRARLYGRAPSVRSAPRAGMRSSRATGARGRASRQAQPASRRVAVSAAVIATSVAVPCVSSAR